MDMEVWVDWRDGLEGNAQNLATPMDFDDIAIVYHPEKDTGESFSCGQKRAISIWNLYTLPRLPTSWCALSSKKGQTGKKGFVLVGLIGIASIGDSAKVYDGNLQLVQALDHCNPPVVQSSEVVAKIVFTGLTFVHLVRKLVDGSCR